MSSSWSSFSSSLSLSQRFSYRFSHFSFFFSVSLKSQFSFIPFIFFVFFFFLFFFSRVKRNAIHFCWHGSHPFSHLALLQPLPGRCCRSRTVPPAACPAFSHAPRDQSHPPNRLRWEVKRWGPPNEKRSGKITTTVQKQTKSKQVQHSIPQIKLDCYICHFGLPICIFSACIYFYF